MGEGAAVLVLERADAARARGARVLGVVRGYGASSDAHHLTAPRDDGAGQAAAMTAALADARVVPEQIDYVNAHGTSTPLNDRAETHAIKLALGEHAKRIPISSTKSAIGHLLGAAGAVEAVATLLALRDRVAPPTIGLTEPDEGLDLDYVPGAARARWRPADAGAGAGAVQLVRLRRAQRRAVPGGGMTLALLERPNERLRPLERLEVLADPGSLQLLRTQVRSRRMGERARPGDGVLAAHARVDGRQVYCYAQDASFAGGSLGEAHAATIVEVLRLAGRARVPVLGFVESAGARMQEGLAALSGYGAIFREHVRLSGVVPQISIVCGPAAGGSSYGPALDDFVIMAGSASMFLTGPAVVSEVTGEALDMAALGGRACTSETASATSAPPPRSTARCWHATCSTTCPSTPASSRRCGPPSPRPGPARPRCAQQARKVYDMRHVAAALVDGGRRWRSARAGRATSSARSPAWTGARSASSQTSPGTSAACSTPSAAQKAARFVRTCNSFGLPLLVLVDTPGFLPGSRQERDGVIRHGAKLVHAFAEAHRAERHGDRAQGLRRRLHRDELQGARRRLRVRLARRRVGVMGAEQAVGILNRREIAAAEDPAAHRRRLAGAYSSEHLHVDGAERRRLVDEVIAPTPRASAWPPVLSRSPACNRPESRVQPTSRSEEQRCAGPIRSSVCQSGSDSSAEAPPCAKPT